MSSEKPAPVSEPVEDFDENVMDDDRDELETGPSGKASAFEISVSRSLYRKLIAKAELEGIPLNDLVGELLAEGIVLRAWEIMEKKATMRGAAPSGGGGQGNARQGRGGNRGGNSFNRSRGGGGGQGGGGQGRRQNYKNIMEDSANFLEYVRSQEKKNKR